VDFEWDDSKNELNVIKHGVSFEIAQRAFLDPRRIIALDTRHSTRKEKRYFCFGRVDDIVLTVRFTRRQGKIRIFGAGAWREGRSIYEHQNEI
jgi:uncharacterized DUF497 family protein